MKNFPDPDPFDALEKRLQAYTEQPDELVWENIDDRLRPNRTPGWLFWVDHGTAVISIVLFALLLSGNQSNEPVSKHKISKAEEPAIVHDKINDLHREKNTSENHRERSVKSADESISPAAVIKEYAQQNYDMQPRVDALKTHENQNFLDTLVSGSSLSRTQNEFSATEITNDTLNILPSKIDVDSSKQMLPEVKDSRRVRKRRLTFYANVSPALSFVRVIPVSSDGVVVSEFSNPSILSAERFGLSVDAGVQGFITKRLEYYGGVSFYQQHQKLHYSYQSGNQLALESEGDMSYVVTPKSSVGIIDYSMLNLGLHAGVLYHLYGENLAHKVGGGLSYQQGFNKNGSEAYQNSESRYFSYQIFYRNELRVNKRLRIFVQPSFTQSIQVREKLTAPFHLKPYRAGIGFGILYNF
jgi:hypothetical protein